MFPPSCPQEQIFNEVKPFIQSALDGENVCIFAYGQTGSGKTYTMEGPPYSNLHSGDAIGTVDELSGILPRTAEFIFAEIERQKHHGLQKDFHIQISSIEIYCDNVRDLYSTD